jgi:hypothetical protein
MTRDEEIRHDLERQWQAADAEKTGQNRRMVAEDIREFVASVKDFATRKKAQARQCSSAGGIRFGCRSTNHIPSYHKRAGHREFIQVVSITSP